jgi:hypothetical protein
MARIRRVAARRGDLESVNGTFDFFQERRQRMAGDDAAVGDLRLVLESLICCKI